jgi:hypothetical protein
MKICPVVAELIHVDGQKEQTDMMKPIGAVCKYMYTPKTCGYSI